MLTLAGGHASGFHPVVSPVEESWVVIVDVLVSHKRAQELVRLQAALRGSSNVMRVFIEISVDEIDGCILGSVVSIALFRRQTRCDHFTSPIELRRNEMCPFFQAEADEGFHDCNHTMRTIF